MNISLPLRICNVVGHQLIGQGRLDEAKFVFEGISRRFPQKVYGYLGAALVAMSTEEWSNAINNWNQVILEHFPRHEGALRGLGLAHTQLKNYELAKSNFLKYIQIYPDKSLGYEGMAFLSSVTYQWEEADKWWATSIDKTQSRKSYLSRARLLVRHTQFDEGLAIMDKLISREGQNENLLTYKAELLIMASKYTQVINLLADLHNQTPSRKVQRLYAQALIGAKRYEEANNLIDQISFQTPDKNSLKSNDPEMIIHLLKVWQKNYREGRSVEKLKIFGIGLSRTGTTSLTKALDILGFDILHFSNPITKRILDLEDFYYFDGFTDSPVSYRFEDLYTRFPNAKFIYTERNLEDWVRSNSELYKPVGFSTTQEMKAWFTQPKRNKFSKIFQNYHPTYRSAYESLYADFPNWEEAYHAFDKRVNLFFEDKPSEKFLRINICDGEGWEKLCSFLDVQIPNAPFPHRNNKSTKDS